MTKKEKLLLWTRAHDEMDTARELKRAMDAETDERRRQWLKLGARHHWLLAKWAEQMYEEMTGDQCPPL